MNEKVNPRKRKRDDSDLLENKIIVNENLGFLPHELIRYIDDFSINKSLALSSKRYHQILSPLNKFKYITKLLHLIMKIINQSGDLKLYYNLQTLNCNNTRITEIPKELINLIELDCCDTRITEIPKELTKLEKLWCSNTLITEIPKELTNLKELKCGDTQITEIPKELINLIELNCSNTRITEIPNILVNLQELICSNTQITEICK